MRSVIQESSSLEKAIKLGWEKAGRPFEFSVKVYEKEVKNFFGFTKKPAKIGIFVHDRQRNNRYRRPKNQDTFRRRRPGQRRRNPGPQSDQQKDQQQYIFDAKGQDKKPQKYRGGRNQRWRRPDPKKDPNKDSSK